MTFTNSPAPAPAPAPAYVSCKEPIKCDYSGYVEKNKYSNLILEKNNLENQLKSSEIARNLQSDTINTLKLTNKNLQTQIARKDTTSIIKLSPKITQNSCDKKKFISLVNHNKIIKLEENKNKKKLSNYILKSEYNKTLANLIKSQDNNQIYKKTLEKYKKKNKFYKFPGFWIVIILLISIFSGIIYFLFNKKSNNSFNL